MNYSAPPTLPAVMSPLAAVKIADEALKGSRRQRQSGEKPKTNCVMTPRTSLAGMFKKTKKFHTQHWPTTAASAEAVKTVPSPTEFSCCHNVDTELILLIIYIYFYNNISCSFHCIPHFLLVCVCLCCSLIALIFFHLFQGSPQSNRASGTQTDSVW